MTAADLRLGAGGRPRTSRGVRSGDDWITSALVLFALLVTITGFNSILTGSIWLAQLGLVCLLILGAAAVTRKISRSIVLPPLVSAAAFLAAITAVFTPGTGFLVLIPTPDTFAAFGGLLQRATTSINEQTLPANADVGITFVLCLGVAAIALAADIAALMARAPALVGIPLLVLVAAPPFIRPGTIEPFTFGCAAASYLVLLRVGSPRGQGAFSAGFGAAIVVLSLVVPFALPAPGPQAGSAANGAFGTGVNPILSLGNDLRQDSNHAVLTYSTRSGVAQYLRLASIVDFSGASWAPDSFETDRKNTVNRIASAPGLASTVKTVRDSTTVKVAALTSRWLPLPYPTNRVTGLTGDWFWDTDGHAVSSADRTSAGQKYTAAVLTVAPTGAQLLAGGTTVPGGLDRYLAIPRGLPSVIGTTARSVTGTASTNYEKAVALQSYFHDTEFEYSETAPVTAGYDGTGGQVIARFLKTKSGYCIHFASAMAMMARTLGIPSRISVGFLPGHVVSGIGAQRLYEVDSHDLHAWPELYFAGVGWTRFEPTVSRGDVPSYATETAVTETAPLVSGSQTPGSPASRSAAPSAPARSVPSDAASVPGQVTRAGGGTTWLGLLIAIVLLALASLVPGALRVGQRRRRVGSGSLGEGWREILQASADVGNPIGATLTPREAAAALRVGPRAAPALDRLLGALERERFGPVSPSYPAAADIRTIVNSLFESARPRTRVRALLYPSSLWRGILRRGDLGETTETWARRTPGTR